MEQVRLGASGRMVSRLGLGCMGMSGCTGRPSDEAGSRYPEEQMAMLDSER